MKFNNWILLGIIGLVIGCGEYAELRKHSDFHIRSNSLADSVDQTGNLTIESAPGKITLKNATPQPLNLGKMILSFDLVQPTGIGSVWGSPWLSWAPTAQSNPALGKFEFKNTSNLDSGALGVGQSITFEYSPSPWGTPNKPSQIKLRTIVQSQIPALIQTEVEQGNFQVSIRVKNISTQTYNLGGAQLQFSYSGGTIWGVWGSPWVGWQVKQSDTQVTLTAPESSQAQLRPSDVMTIVFAGTGAVSQVQLKVTTDSSPNPDPTPSVSVTPSPSVSPSVSPSPSPSVSPSVSPSPSPSVSPSATPSPSPSVTPSVSPSPSPTASPTPGSGKLYVGYFQTWSENWSSTGANTGLAKLPSYVNVVNLSFMKPDAIYNGNLDLSGTGVDYSSGGQILKEAIAVLHQRNPNTKVLIAVGGATYTNWAQLNENGIARFVKDFGLDGVDIDYEPHNPGCTLQSNTVSCQSDQQYIQIMDRLRKVLPRPAFISMAVWSIGAYGTGSYVNAQPQGAYTGVAVNPLKSVAAKGIDLLNIMSYDASNAYDPKVALLAYKSLFPGPLALGVEVPPEAWGGHVLTMSELDTLIDFVIQQNASGMMLWSLQKMVNGAPSPTNPSASMISVQICKRLNLAGSCPAL